MAIIGGGITGLTIAFKLRQRGIGCTLYEASARTGGVIETVQKNGWLVECGPNSILDTSPKLGEFIAELGLERNRLNAGAKAKNRYIVRNRQPVALPASPPALFSSPAFSAKAKLRLMAEPFIGSKSTESESLADFVLRRLGREFLDYAISPFVSGVYAGDPARLSVKHAFPKLYALEQEYGSLIKGAILGARKRKKRKEVSKKDARMFSFDNGMETLPKRLAERMADVIRLETPVQSIRRTETGRWLVDGSEHDGVVLAVPAHVISTLDLPVDLGGFSDIYYPSVASLSLGFHTVQFAHPLDGFGMLIPRVEGFYSLGSLFTSSIFSGRAPEGRVVLTTFVGGSLAPEKALQNEDEMLKCVLADMRVLLGLQGEPEYRNLRVYPQAIPQYTVGYERFLDAMNSAEKELPGLHFAGHYRDGISVADSILSGLTVAERIAP